MNDVMTRGETRAEFAADALEKLVTLINENPAQIPQHDINSLKAMLVTMEKHPKSKFTYLEALTVLQPINSAIDGILKNGSAYPEMKEETKRILAEAYKVLSPMAGQLLERGYISNNIDLRQYKAVPDVHRSKKADKPESDPQPDEAALRNAARLNVDADGYLISRKPPKKVESLYGAGNPQPSGNELWAAALAQENGMGGRKI